MERCTQTEMETQTPVENGDKVKIRYCKLHSEKEINGFCEDCEEFFCKECMEDHMDHEIESLKKFCKERKENILKQVSVSELSAHLKKKEDELTKTKDKLYKELENTNEMITLKETVIKDGKEAAFKQEMCCIEAVCKYLIGLEDKASSVTLKNACEDAMGHFINIKDGIRKEFETIEKELETAKIRMRELEKELDEINRDASVFDYLKEDGKYEFDDEKWATFLLLNEKTPLFNTINNFEAFSSVKTVFDIKGVMNQKIVDVGEGVKMSEPLKVERELLTGGCIYSSLSHNGILAICVNDNTLQFTDLNNDRQVGMDIDNYTVVGFYDSNILLLTYQMPLREATVENVFDNPNIKTFKEIEGTKDVDPYTDVSLLNERRILYYRIANGDLFSFNTDTKENTRIAIGNRIWTIASLTGIDCNVKAVFRDDGDRCIYTLNIDNTITKVDGDHYYDITALFPLSSDPKNINDAVFKYTQNLIKDGNYIDTRHLIEFDGNYSVIRVYKDIFLAYDKNIKSWVLLRIITP